MTTFNNNQNSTSTTTEKPVIQEHLRQEKLSFNLALNLTRISAIIIITILGFFMSGKISETTAVTASEIASKLVIVGLKMTKYTNERRDK
ncbi:MAG: hypothetical protein F6K25_01795 [Okeania sp. SIO2G4]|uniref:TRADD-N-associated membrane domain-containing protein n=1 Tax=unclassified Okeania TaxID=2634635 RepID=UPI0013BBB6D7|nr:MULTISPECIES: hypothetical protein [unclassified Okeania]NEP04791.1 hypothetical protein [Okeania sp. SIO4D6]NEP38907.1 hypothetical protein [Okeania sp. SIO2H7]NEP71623.1 hypothetical protein [Okeania sp. SIO2G5]NEP91718.1 hypothetical protein [Okeania sp. SIO2F5]NEQ89545.1 hypothetical protein [Okeania sp. SIO2G4]